MSHSPAQQEQPSDADRRLTRVIASVDDLLKVEGIILFGSWATATNDAASDVDLLVIQRSGPMSEQTLSLLGFTVDVHRETAQGLRQRMLKEHPLNNNFILNALHDGIIYLDRDGSAASLMAEAEALWEAGPNAMSAAEAEATRKGLDKLFMAAQRLSRRASESKQAALIAEMRAHQVVVQSVYLYHRVRRLWTASFQDMLGRMEAEGSPLYGLWEQYVEAGSQEERMRVAALFVDSVYE